MRVLLKISPLLLCIIASQTVFADSPDFSQCTHAINSLVKKNEPNIYGGLNAFYDINKGIADGLQKTMSDQMVTDIYNYFEGTAGHKSLGTIINDVVKSQAGAIAFFCVGLFLILVSLIVGITLCSCRCCCNSCGAKKDDITYPSIWSAAGMLAGLVSIFAFVLTGVIIFNVSSNNLYSAIDESPEWIADVVDGLNSVVNQGTYDMNCTIGTTVDTTFSGLEKQMSDYPQNLIDQYLGNTGLNDLYDFDFPGLYAAIGKAQGQATIATAKVGQVGDGGVQQCTDSKTEMTKKLGDTGNDLGTTETAVKGVEGAKNIAKTQTDRHTKDLLDNVQTPINEAIQQMIIAQYNITTQMNSITGGVNQTMQTVYSLQNAIITAQHDITTWSGYKPVRASWQAVMSVPNCICLFFALTTVAFLGLWIFKGNDTPRGLGYLPIIGFYCVIFLAWMAMGVASATFVGGWAISATCKPMFEDPTFRVYGVADKLTFEISGFNNTHSTITFQQLLESCSAKKTMFKAIGGDTLISVPMVMSMLHLDVQLALLNDAIGQATLTYQFPQPITDNFNTQEALIQGDTKFFDDQQNNFLPGCGNTNDLTDANKALNDFTQTLDDVNAHLQTLGKMVMKVTANSQDNAKQQQQLQTYTDGQFQLANDNINSSVTTLINQLDTNTFPCYPLYESFENAGTIICDWFGRPVHGMWGAAGLAAIFFIPAALLLLCASKTLFTGHREKSFDPIDERTLYADVPAASSVHRTKTTQDPWATEEDPFALPKIRSDAPQALPRVSTTDYYPSQPTAAAAAPWLDDSVSKGSGLRRMDEGLQRTDNYDPYGTESGLRRNDYPESSRRLGEERWGSDAGSGSGTGSRGLRRVDADNDAPSEERWSSSALRRL